MFSIFRVSRISSLEFFQSQQEVQLLRMGTDYMDKDIVRCIIPLTYYHWVRRQVNRYYEVVNIKLAIKARRGPFTFWGMCWTRIYTEASTLFPPFHIWSSSFESPLPLDHVFDSFTSLTFSSRLQLIGMCVCVSFFLLNIWLGSCYLLSLDFICIICKTRLMTDGYVVVSEQGPIQVVISGGLLESPKSVILVFIPFWS